MRLELNNCLIRPWQAGDAPALQRHANNRKIWLNLRDAFPHPYSLEDAEGFLRFVSGQSPATIFAIATDQEAIGCIGLQLGQDVHRRTAELGYWLGERHWGRGIMTEAIGQFTRWGFEHLDLLRIYAQPFAENRASIRALEKAGYTCEGRARANAVKDGKIVDCMIYARLRSDLSI